MSDDDTVETSIDAEAVAAADTADEAEATEAAAEEAVAGDDDTPINDVDGDGKVSILEAERARLGLVDARLEEIAHHGGVTGHIAEVAHKVLDKFDND